MNRRIAHFAVHDLVEPRAVLRAALPFVGIPFHDVHVVPAAVVNDLFALRFQPELVLSDLPVGADADVRHHVRDFLFAYLILHCD